MENSDEERKRLTEKINFAIQGMSENAQFSLGVAVGVFGILVIFVTINDHSRLKTSLKSESEHIR
jgi:hypothetical protein